MGEDGIHGRCKSLWRAIGRWHEFDGEVGRKVRGGGRLRQRGEGEEEVEELGGKGQNRLT